MASYDPSKQMPTTETGRTPPRPSKRCDASAASWRLHHGHTNEAWRAQSPRGTPAGNGLASLDEEKGRPSQCRYIGWRRRVNKWGGSLMPVGDVCCNSSPKHPKTGRTGAAPTHQRPTWNSSRPRLFRKIRGYQSWSSRTHDPKVAGSNPAPATTEIDRLGQPQAVEHFGPLRGSGCSIEA